MPGAVAVRFAREPDYFLGTTIMGKPCDVIVARQLADDALAGMACRAERRSFINGTEATTGYLGQIRLADYQGRWLVQRGARLVREMSAEGLVYLGVIAAENPRARRVLVEHRPPAGCWRRSTLRPDELRDRAQAAPRAPHGRSRGVRPVSAEELPRLVDFLREQGPRRQFFPAYTVDDFTGGTTLGDLAAEDVMIAWRGDQVVGVMAAWDQAAYKQDIVEGIHRDPGARAAGLRPPRATPGGRVR